MSITPELITLGVIASGIIIWGIRLEGRVNAAATTAADLARELAAVNMRADAEAKAHRDTANSLIRVEEQLKYVRELLERHFVTVEPARRRQARDAT